MRCSSRSVYTLSRIRPRALYSCEASNNSRCYLSRYRQSAGCGSVLIHQPSRPTASWLRAMAFGKRQARLTVCFLLDDPGSNSPRMIIARIRARPAHAGLSAELERLSTIPTSDSSAPVRLAELQSNHSRMVSCLNIDVSR